MGIRNAAKAIILHNGKILLDTCNAPGIGEYYALPGGGQHQYETIEEAVVRECLEETGYSVVPEAFVALYEEIYTSESVREKCPDYAHKILHIFRCGLASEDRIVPSEQDSWQLDCTWVDIKNIASIKLLPACVGERIHELIHSPSPVFLGSHCIDLHRSV